MRRIPYGQINFERIIKENYLYVDKTRYIEKLENLNETSLFYLRPGRFGKSLFTSMLDYYYAIDKKRIDDVPLTFAEKQLLKIVRKKIKGTDIELLLEESGLFDEK